MPISLGFYEEIKNYDQHFRDCGVNRNSGWMMARLDCYIMMSKNEVTSHRRSQSL